MSLANGMDEFLITGRCPGYSEEITRDAGRAASYSSCVEDCLKLLHHPSKLVSPNPIISGLLYIEDIFPSIHRRLSVEGQ